jgi:hypothetical protein
MSLNLTVAFPHLEFFVVLDVPILVLSTTIHPLYSMMAAAYVLISTLFSLKFFQMDARVTMSAYPHLQMYAMEKSQCSTLLQETAHKQEHVATLLY